MCICRNWVDTSTTSLEVILICIHDAGMIIGIFGRDRKEINDLKLFQWGIGYFYFVRLWFDYMTENAQA